MKDLHSSKDLLKKIVWNRLWQTKESVNSELKRLTDKYVSLKKDFLAKDEITWEEIYTFEKLDNPLTNQVTLQTILNIENTLKKIPLDKIDKLMMLSKEECHDLLLQFSAVQVQAQTQFLIYSWRLMKYEHAANYLFEIIIKEKLKAYEEIYNKHLENSITLYEEIMKEKDKELEKLKAIHLEKRSQKEKELNALLDDWDLTKLEMRNELKNFDTEYNYWFSDTSSRYKIKAEEIKNAELTKAKMISDKMKRSSLTYEVLTDETYNEFLQKKEIIAQTKNYFSMNFDILKNFQFNIKAIFDKI